MSIPHERSYVRIHLAGGFLESVQCHREASMVHDGMIRGGARGGYFDTTGGTEGHGCICGADTERI